MEVKIIPATNEDAEALVVIQKRAFKRLYDIYRYEGSPFLRGVDEIEKWINRRCYEKAGYTDTGGAYRAERRCNYTCIHGEKGLGGT